MNFLDSFLDNVPIIRDMDKKKRILAAGFVVFAVVSLLGILIDAIAGAGGFVALISVAIGFLLMAAIIIADFVMSRKGQTEYYPEQQEQYNFFDESPDDYGYQDESMGYRANDGPDYNYDNPDYGEEISENNYRDGGDFNDFRDERDSWNQNDYRDDRGFDDGIEYSVESEPEPVNEPQREPERFRRQAPSRFEFRPEPVNMQERMPAAYDDNMIGKPVMTFDSPSQQVGEELRYTADAVAPNISAPPASDVIGGPVMSIPFRGGQTAAVNEAVQEPQRVEPVQPQPIQSAYRPLYQQVQTSQEVPSEVKRSERGQEIEEFFDHMSDDEILYSDCVEVWASDAKPAAVRLLKQVESLSDKKTADSLGREAEYVNAMLDRIYYFTMLDSIKDNLELKKYNFSAMVKECLRRFSPFFMEKRIGLLWKGLDIDIVTDKRWLIFALTQVVFNAVEFTGLGGKIAISAKKEGSMIHLMVDDSGCGIADDDLPHIFMAGFMGDNVPNESGRRTGMGLFITRSVVEKLGGTVTAESTVGKGTRITMILPEKV